MAWYSGKKWTRSELTARIGDPQQLAGARGSILTDGKADGVRAVDVSTGTGFSFTVPCENSIDHRSFQLTDLSLGHKNAS